MVEVTSLWQHFFGAGEWLGLDCQVKVGWCVSHINGAPIPVNCKKQACFFRVGGRRKFFAIKFFGVGKNKCWYMVKGSLSKTVFIVLFWGMGKKVGSQS